MHLDNGISVGKSFLHSSPCYRIMGAKEVNAMICPYCDSLLRTVPENGCCPNCNAPLGAVPQEEENLFPAPPLGIYKSNNTWLEIGENSVRIRQEKLAFAQYTDYEIRYDELTGVLLQPAEQATDGFLSLRCTLNQNMPFPKNSIEAFNDPTSMDFRVGMNTQMEQLVAFFRLCVNVAKSRRKEKEQSAQIQLPPELQGVYKGYMGKLELGETAMSVTSENAVLPNSCYTIDYDALVAVKYVLSTFRMNNCLHIRCWHNRRMEFTKKASDRETSILFFINHEKDFKKLYLVLEDICRRANAAREKCE